MESSSSPSSGRRSPRFQTTRWSVMGAAATETEREAAWRHFSQNYWYPIYAYIRRRGTPAADAADLTQSFFAKLIAQNWLAEVERRDTRFSTLLITVLQHFLSNEHRRATSQKRGGAELHLSLDLPQAESWYAREDSSGLPPEAEFERTWARSVMSTVLAQLEEECRLSGRTALFTALQPFLSREAAEGDYARAAEQLGLAPRSVAVAVHRLRSEFRGLLRAELAAGLKSEAQIDEELRALAAALRGTL